MLNSAKDSGSGTLVQGTPGVGEQVWLPPSTDSTELLRVTAQVLVL